MYFISNNMNSKLGKIERVNFNNKEIIVSNVSESMNERKSEPICRICHNGGNEIELINVCEYKGSLEYIHEVCMIEWMRRSKSLTCGLCKTIYHKTEIFNWRYAKNRGWRSIMIIGYYIILFGLMTFLISGFTFYLINYFAVGRSEGLSYIGVFGLILIAMLIYHIPGKFNHYLKRYKQIIIKNQIHPCNSLKMKQLKKL
ncbi:hypothetical protein A3Q56_00178 [Intoshia linei]|uniref:RING-CH-type domain-containing protein n=1 Tax=Intoshia linei TaxID=1819745 RepID=A0A177BCL6_9BILA|nr:hypothetical protein A3Q56_00178 [Intoshia linei]